MKTTTTIKQTLLALTIALSIVSCKKDKKDEPTPPPAAAQPIALTDLKALSTGASVKVPDAKKITGIVISDVSNKNIDSKTVVLQDAASQVGIIVTFDAAQTFAVGDQVEVDISGQTLAQVNGEIELTNVPAAKAKKTGTGTITPKTTTTADIATNKAAWDGTLVTIAATDLSGTTAKYSGTLTIKDASGTVTSAVLAGASFETTDLPASVSSVTGIVRTGGTDTRVDIRKTADVTTGAITKVITEDFTNVSWTKYAENGYDPTYLGSGGGDFTTAAGHWTLNETFQQYASSLWYFPGSKFDGDFTTAGKSYVYMAKGAPYSTPMMTAFTNIKGLKQVSVTFAGSKMNGKGVLVENIPNGTYQGDPGLAIDVKPFNPATDYVQISIVPVIIDDPDYDVSYGTEITKLAVSSVKYTTLGKFNTFTWTAPTKDQLTAAGVSAGDADKWLANPQIDITNISSRNNDPNLFAPVLFDKVVFGF